MRPRRDPSGVSRPRPGPGMTDTEWAAVEILAQRENVRVTEAMRRLMAAGAVALDVAPPGGAQERDTNTPCAKPQEPL